MTPGGRHPDDGAFSVLRRFARMRNAGERCEICSGSLAPDHAHLIDPAARKLTCACDACAVLFLGTHAKYRRVPRTIRLLTGFRLSAAQWDSLLIPIEMAFFFHSSHAGRIVAIYPSPAGPTESLLPLETWQDVVRDNPVLESMEPDVEALVANRLGPARREVMDGEWQEEYYILPIDECFRLVGLMRLNWKGLSGGTDVWREIAGFFAAMRSRAIHSGEPLRA